MTQAAQRAVGVGKGLRIVLRRLLPRPRPPLTIFLHIPKTGGISLRSLLLREHAPARTFRILNPVDDAAALRALPNDARSRLTLVEGHLYYGIHECLRAGGQYITILRDPIERTLSWYSYISTRAWHPLFEQTRHGLMSLADCCRSRLSVELDNFMTRALSHERFIDVPFGKVTREMFDEAAKHLSSMVVMTTETLDADVGAYQRLAGIRRRSAPHLNRTRDRLQRAAVSHADANLIESHNEYDRELFELARRSHVALQA